MDFEPFPDPVIAIPRQFYAKGKRKCAVSKAEGYQQNLR